MRGFHAWPAKLRRRAGGSRRKNFFTLRRKKSPLPIKRGWTKPGINKRRTKMLIFTGEGGGKTHIPPREGVGAYGWEGKRNWGGGGKENTFS